MKNRRNFIIAATSFATSMIALPAFAGSELKGSFEGKSNHVTTGQVKLVTEGDKTFVELQSDFKFDGAPDPRVALGNNGYDRTMLLGKLHSNSGKQRYQIPARIETSGVNEVWIWCKKFNVPLGVATLH